MKKFKYSQILNTAQIIVGSLMGALVLYSPDVKAAFTPLVSTGILVGVAALNGVLTKMKQDL